MTAQPSAKTLILELLQARNAGAFAVRDVILAAQLFDIGESAVRVTFTRLAAAGLVEGAGRGCYRLGPAAAGLAADVARWREAGQGLRDWTGGWIAVQCGALGRSDRGALQVRLRALGLAGFAEFERDFHLRPDNLPGGIEVLRRRLRGLGLEPAAPVFLAGSFEAPHEAAARALWDGAALNVGYRHLRQQMDDWLEGAFALAPDVAAREAFLLGSQAIRRVIYDPLLPAPLVDVAEREAFFAATRRFDAAGRRLWQRFFAATANNDDRTKEGERHERLPPDRRFHA